MSPNMTDKQVALVFDFDGTVAPDVMLSPIFNMIGINPDIFWEKTGSLTEEGYDREIAYLQALLLICAEKEISLSNSMIRDLGSSLQFYHGFPDILDRLLSMIEPNTAEISAFEIAS